MLLACVHLRCIENEFRKHYGKEPEDRFAMEIEFKVESDGKLLIKRARLRIYHHAPERRTI